MVPDAMWLLRTFYAQEREVKMTSHQSRWKDLLPQSPLGGRQERKRGST
jgi:hypothetical protein